MLDEKVWIGTDVDGWEQFVRLAAGATPPPRSGGTILFRGQPSDWNLKPTLLRMLPNDVSAAVAVRAERDALNHFKSQAHLHYAPSTFPLNGATPELADWWALMQHHGAPTRLVDWTASPYVALYFAVEKLPEADGVVLVIDAERARSAFRTTYPNSRLTEEFFIREDAPKGLRVFTPFHKTPRLVTQQGYFTVSLQVLDTQDELLAAAGAIVRRWPVPARLKPILLHHLRAMNVAAHSLFPGLDGLGRSAAELIRTATI